MEKAHTHLTEQMDKLDGDEKQEVEKQAKAEQKKEQETNDQEAKEQKAKDEKKKAAKKEKKAEAKKEHKEDEAQIQTAADSSALSKNLLELHQQLYSKIKKAKMMHKSIVKVEKLIKKHKKEF